MKRSKIQFNKIKLLGVLATICFGYLTFISPHELAEAAKSAATHIGTFEGSTTFIASSSNGINPGLFIEVVDDKGKLTQYESEEGVITIPNTKEGAYVTQAKLLGKTKYVDEETGEILDQWEEGRDLRLESVQMPVLTTTGKNLYPYGDVSFTPIEYNWYDAVGTIKMYGDIGSKSKSRFLLKKGSYTFSTNGEKNISIIQLVDDNEILYRNGTGSFTLNEDTYLTLRVKPVEETSNSPLLIQNIQIEEGSAKTSYESYKANILTVNEEVELHGIGDVRDELDLIKMELTKKISQPVILDGSSDESYVQSVLNLNNTIPFGFVEQDMKRNGASVNNAFITTSIGNGDYEHSYASTHGDKLVIWFFINKSKLSTQNIDGFRQWLQVNPVMAQYELETPIIKTVGLNSDYLFKPIYQEFIEVIGTVSPLVGSITVPTNSISFTLDPNQEAGQQFIAPEFSVSNEANAPIRLTLNSFEQTTTVLNDVLPDKYDSWEGFNKKESKDIALALVPKAGDGWLSLNEEPRYVADTLNNDLGVIKAKSTVDFTFSALHGQAFEETLNPSYRLGFVFEFMN